MTETWIIVGVVLLAVLVGFLIPVLLQLRLTLKSARQALWQIGPKLDQTLAEVQQATQRVNRVGAKLEDSSEHVSSLFKEAGELAQSVRQLRRSLRTAAAIGSAVGPAIVAALNGFSSAREAKEAAKAGPPESSEPNSTTQKKKELTHEG